MQGYKPGRLHRVLDRAGIAPGLPKFYLGLGNLGAGGGSYSDASIVSLSINRGKSERGGGYTPATVEAQYLGEPASESLAGQHLRAAMGVQAAYDLAVLTGTTQAAILDRGQGRVGLISVEDRGDKKQPITTAASASWMNMNRYLPATVTPVGGQTLNNIIQLITPQEEQAYVDLNFLGTTDTINASQDPVRWGDAISKYAESPGILMRERRDGVTDVISVNHRDTMAQARLTTHIPLTRAQVLAPAEWSQPNQEIGVRVVFKSNRSTGSPFTQTVDHTDNGLRMRETLNIDWSYIRSGGNFGQLYREASGIVYDRSPQDFRLPTVKIDILSLIASGKSYHLEQVKNMLTLEAGDPVFLSADWPPMIQGVQFAEGIKETIDTNTWELELSLLPYSSVTGLSPSPVVPGRVWDSMPGRWDDQIKRWDEN